MAMQGGASPKRRVESGADGAGTRLPPVPPKPAVRAGGDDASDSGEAELDREQIAELRKALETQRASVVVSIEGRRHEERDIGREVGDEMDEANVEGVASMASKLLEREVRLLNEIDHALAKLEQGTYGLCEGTGEPIGYQRLKLRPWARYSVAYQEELEREERTRGGL